jgi:hypothetical protein
MKLSKMFGLLAVAALALMAFASTASATTTLETNGVKQTSVIELNSSLSGSAVLKDTSGAFANTCTSSSVIGKDSTSTTGATVSGPISTLSFSNCTHSPVVVDAAGTLSVENISGTTNGTLRSSGAKVTTPVTIFGSVVTATCTTENTDIGTLKGVASGSATIEINAVLNCGSFLPSAKWEGKYVTTTSTGGAHAIGVTS